VDESEIGSANEKGALGRPFHFLCAALPRGAEKIGVQCPGRPSSTGGTYPCG